MVEGHVGEEPIVVNVERTRADAQQANFGHTQRHGKRHVGGVEAQRRGPIHILIGMVDSVKAPQHRHTVGGDVPMISGEIEQNDADDIAQPCRTLDFLRQPHALCFDARGDAACKRAFGQCDDGEAERAEAEIDGQARSTALLGSAAWPAALGEPEQPDSDYKRCTDCPLLSHGGYSLVCPANTQAPKDTQMTDTPPATLPDDYTISRRGATAAIAAGYAVLATAADAVPITTPSKGLVIEEVTMGGGLPGYVARPSTPGTHPAVIVVSEIFGVHEWIKDVCRRLAQAGYVAVAPNFFYRADPENTLPTLTEMTEVRKIVATAGLDQQMADVRTAVQWLGGKSYAAKGRTGITGFCWGGSVVWMAAATVPGIKAGGAWYGRLSGGTDTSRLYPMTAVEQLKAPVLGLYGALDKGIPVTDVEAMSAALAAAKNPVANASMIALYQEADHGFLADYRPSFNEAAAGDAWTKLLAHFKANV